MQNIDSYKKFKGKISPFIKIKLNSVFSVHDVYDVKLLSRLMALTLCSFPDGVLLKTDSYVFINT